jgi:hypothetical protein
MYADSPEGETSKRTLEADDIDAVCTIYPAGAPTPGGMAPPTGISRGALTSATSCTAVSGSRSGVAPPIALVLVAVLLVARRLRT